MTTKNSGPSAIAPEDDEQIVELVGYDFGDFGVTRRSFVQALGAGLLIAVTAGSARGQDSRPEREGGGGERRAHGGFGRPAPVELGARLHIGKDGSITVLTGKVEGGQGAR